MYDVIIIGAGPAGISASIYANNANLKTLLIEKKMPGGLLNIVNTIDNYPGFIGTGPDLAMAMYSQLKKLDIDYKSETVIDVLNDEDISVKTNKDTYKTKYLLITSGRSPRKLEVENSDKFLGKGLSYCALCDGHFFKDKDVAIVGESKTAIDEAIYLSTLASKVYIISRDNLTISKDIKNIVTLNNTTIKSLNGSDALESITLNDNKTLNVSGLFSYTGYTPNNTYLSKLGIVSNDGYIKVTDGKTIIPNIYAAGDAIKKDVYQVVNAVSEGALCITKIKKELNK